MSTCPKCRLSHERLGIRIESGTLFRLVDQQRHKLRISGGAWAYESALLTAHPEVREFEIVERTTGEVWRTNRETFNRHAFPFTAGGRHQMALAVQWWNTRAEAETIHTDTDTSTAPAQLSLF